MLRCTRIVMSLWLACLAALLSQAQESADLYAGLPMTRTADGAFVLGEPSASVKLIEFSDFLCTSCQNYEPIIQNFIEDYVRSGQAQFEYRIFPVVDAELSVLSASMVECADTLQPGAFWPAHDLMFEIVSTQGFTAESRAEFTATLGLDAAALGDCTATATQHAADSAYGLQLGLRGTPSLFVQYGAAAPLPIALALPEHYPAIVNAIRPQTSEAVTIEQGRYAGLSAYRRADGGFVLGDASAPLTIVTFEDFLCPHCQNYQSVLQSFIDEYVRAGRAQFEYRFYPLVNPQFSTETAKIAECVAAQDLAAFWDAHDLLYEFAAAGNLGGAMAADLANLLGLDAATLADCLGRAMQFLVDTHLGQSIGVSGTPAIRARDSAGQLQIIYAAGQPLDRGGAPPDVLAALAEGEPNVSIGPPEQKLLVDDSLLSGEPCAAPCWQNIVPGSTTVEAALEIVGGLADIHIFEAGETEFIFGREMTPCCLIRGADTVDMILLQFEPYLGLGELIAQYGEPPLLRAYLVDENHAQLLFYYPEPGLGLFSLLPIAAPELTEDLPIMSALYGTEEFFSGSLPAEAFQAWRGYLSYEEYMGGE